MAWDRTTTLADMDAQEAALLVAIQASAAVFAGTSYFVATDGNDANTGLSADVPFLTIGYAITQAVAGDAIRVKAGAMTDLTKLDSLATTGLTGVHNSLAYRVAELDRHIHGRARRWGALAAPDETNAIEANVTRPFVAVSGNDDWGTAIPVVGTDDVPVPSDAASYFDLHHILISEVDHDTAYRIRIIYGTGTSAAAIIAEQWSEFMFFSGTGPKSTPAALAIMMPRRLVGTKVWVQAWNATNLSEVDFYIGCHGYEG